jgi:eukaryotic-like serine/threonine-protein kinase
LQRVAFGGMAEILLAIEDTPHAGKRFVTIKRIREEFARDPDYIDFFISEGRVSMQCSHANLVNAFDLDTVDDVHYLAMEYIRGHTLLDLIRACYRAETSLSVATVLRIATEVAAALEHLHEMRDVEGQPMRVVHRDVTPQNIMIDANGSVKLIDLGIARSEVQVHTTRVGTVKGKLSYIAPEALNNRKQVDHRADIFSLGIVLHESLTTKGLFRGNDDQDTLERIRKMTIPRVSSIRPDLPPEVDEIIDRALERRVRHRYQSASELLRALDSLTTIIPAAPITQLRDEVLALCGDPPVPTLGGESFTALRTALRRGSSPKLEAEPIATTEAGAPSKQPTLTHFLEHGGVNVAAAARRARELDPDKPLGK